MPAPLLLTMGEPAGIGGELSLAAWLRREAEALPAFTVLDDPERLARLARSLEWPVPVRVVQSCAEAADIWRTALPVLPIGLDAVAEPGRPGPATAPAVIASIERGVALVRGGEAAALVTNPIQKSALMAAGFGFPGHTEFLASLDEGSPLPVMMLASPVLRVVPVTVHEALAEAIRALTPDLLARTLIVLDAALRRDFGIADPRIAVAGLNPHAGEGGAFGHEEALVIGPVLDRLRDEGIDLAGPLPADTMFHAAARARYDAAACMYHDQALIPIKTLDFERAVNVTLGLSFIRTSPDHGTALDIAGTGRANPASLIEALRMAERMAAARHLYDAAR